VICERLLVHGFGPSAIVRINRRIRLRRIRRCHGLGRFLLDAGCRITDRTLRSDYVIGDRRGVQ